MRYLTAAIFLIALLGSDKNHLSNGIDVRIVEDTVNVYDVSQEFELTIELNNTTNTNFLLYGFDSNQISSTSIERLCDVEKVSSGIAIILYNSFNKIQFPTKLIPDTLKYKSTSDSTFKQRFKDSTDKYLAGTRVSKKKVVTIFKRKISLWRYSIQPGIYRLKVIYFCGKGIFHPAVVGHERIEIDKRNADAETLLGCVVSNDVIIYIH